MKNPYDIIKSRYVTEKAAVLERLHTATSNRSLARCDSPKYVFIVDRSANKQEIKGAIETIYREKGLKVIDVNTILMKPKAKKRGKGRPGAKPAFKKAIITMEPGDLIDEV